MKRQFLVPLGAGLAIAILAVAGMLYMQRGAHLELSGGIRKVRTLAVEDTAAIAVADFHVTNSSDVQFVVRKVELRLEQAGGKVVEGAVVSEMDAQRLFEAYPAFGQKFNPTLVAKTKIEGRQSVDRMIAARFEVPEKLLAERKRLVLRIEDVDGLFSEITEAGK